MKIFLTDQQKHFSKHLEGLKTVDIISYDINQLKHKTDNIELNCKFSDFDFPRLFNYQIFSTNILSALPQWIQEGRNIQTGDTIVQQINIPPSKTLAQRIIVGVRIKDVIDKEYCRGFSYETLQGHVEKGISLFQVEQVNDKVIFKIETYSAPAYSLLKLFQPISSWYQDYCTKKALQNIATRSLTSTLNP
jgi:uncharacterized protein DUF1990